MGRLSTADRRLVLADDLSGAAELAGVAVRYGCTAEVWTEAGEGPFPEVVCFDAETRLLAAADAARRTRVLTTQLRALGQWRLFKKTDSLLRGHVREEIAAVLQASGLTRSVLCPANPSRGRVVRGGRYFVDGIPLDQTALARDPTHPRATADVAALLGGMPDWLETPDIDCRADLLAQVPLADGETLPAGGAEFFEAQLVASGAVPVIQEPPTLAGRGVFACGSPAAWANGRAREMAEFAIETVRLSSTAATQAVARLDERGLVQLAIADAQGSPDEVGHQFAAAVARVLSERPVDLLFLEGGATAIGVMRQLGWTRLQAVAELSPGTVLLAEHAGRTPRLVVKPGSYPWPTGMIHRCGPTRCGGEPR